MTDTETATQLITKYIGDHFPYVADIEEALRHLQNGELHLTLRVFKGGVQDMIVTTSERKTYGKK